MPGQQTDGLRHHHTHAQQFWSGVPWWRCKGARAMPAVAVRSAMPAVAGESAAWWPGGFVLRHALADTPTRRHAAHPLPCSSSTRSSPA